MNEAERERLAESWGEYKRLSVDAVQPASAVQEAVERLRRALDEAEALLTRFLTLLESYERSASGS